MAHAWQSLLRWVIWDVTQHHHSPIISLCHSLTLLSSFIVHGEKCLSLDWSPCWGQGTCSVCVCVVCLLYSEPGFWRLEIPLPCDAPQQNTWPLCYVIQIHKYLRHRGSTCLILQTQRDSALKKCASAAKVTWNIYAWETCVFSQREKSQEQTLEWLYPKQQKWYKRYPQPYFVNDRIQRTVHFFNRWMRAPCIPGTVADTGGLAVNKVVKISALPELAFW